ncbi:surface antigen BspA-like [Trichomonas vaginalis G3]|uniref:Surface antigen BspA-like n=1 Tax=Trichomonas vaginalis (strain ATCC PRA-98 / G3) TaxID=412133 RepID=A2DKQ9_TRIV3|nr:leucine-rich repeats (6 copies)-containing protein [Trichomonas vaginalis G3]EAY19042.1 surface antigen BspA-like [Trichomonas vaginalis G3]KAI5521164.1 leucine-rich repeats (6 copies)-containing protein [Trichomonas vaginalis G3]|eukprot:XP_001580028.1 surface antigen BspA-like [Trichomonas vaginalis G3]
MLKEINIKAFGSCSSISKIIFPYMLEYIGASAFDSCAYLTQITFSNSLKAINESAFDGCKNLIKIDLPDSLEIIGEMAFKSCSSLQELNLPENLRFIGVNAFYGTNLRKITICMKSEVKIGEKVFGPLNQLEELVFYSNNYEILKFIQSSPIHKITFDSILISNIPVLNSSQYLENLIIKDHGIPVSFINHFVVSHNISIYVYGNIRSIESDSFVDAGIKEFVYCGNDTVSGDFLTRALSCNSVQCSKNYKKNTFGGKRITYNTDICKDYSPNTGMSKTTKIILSVIIPIGAISIIVGIIWALKLRKEHNAINSKLLIQRLVVEDFG